MAATSGLAAVIKRRVYGVLFLVVLAGLLALSVLLYQKAFTDVVRVTLQASSAGNQLTAPADVKLRGLIVGEVRKISSNGEGATLDLALDPDQVELIPQNVSARLLPKTLFGEKYVDLVLPEDPAQDSLSEGDVIPQDRVTLGRETEQTLNDLLPLLRTLKPAELSVTLNALSTALRGRGDQLGENLELVDSYLREFNPEIDALGENFGGVADFVDNLEAARPDFLKLLDNLSAINRNLVDSEQELNTFLTASTGFAQEMNRFLTENETRLVRLAKDSRPPLELFAKYAPEYPCFFKGLDRQTDLIAATFGGLQPGLHITLEFTEDQDEYEPERDEPSYLDTRGPRCYGLPDPEGQAEDINFRDGYRDELGPDTTQSDGQEDGAGAAKSPTDDPTTALASPAGQRAVMGAVLAPVMGVSVDEVPDLAYLLFGPMARGTEVGLS